MRRFGFALLGALLLTASASAQTYIPGLFVGTSKGPVELIAWAELQPNGTLRMADGTSLEDVPMVDTAQRVLCSLANATVLGVWVAGENIFRDGYAERREVAWTYRMLNVFTMDVRAVDLEDPEKVARLVRPVRPSGSDPAFAFVTVGIGVGRRHYPIRLR